HRAIRSGRRHGSERRQSVLSSSGGDLPFRGGLGFDDLLPGGIQGLDVLLFGRRQEIEEEPGCEVVLAGPRGLVTFSIAPQVRPRVKQAIVTLLGVNWLIALEF